MEDIGSIFIGVLIALFFVFIVWTGTPIVRTTSSGEYYITTHDYNYKLVSPNHFNIETSLKEKK